MSLLDGKVFTGGPVLLGARDTGPARLPGLGTVSPTGNASLDTWLRQATEVIEVRNGARGNPWERTVTVREFAAMAKEVDKVMPGAQAMTDLLNGQTTLSATKAIDAFTKSIKELQVYKDLIKRLDDPSRFDNLPGEIREELLRSIAEEAAKRGAAISRVETALQDANRSLAYEVKLVTAAVERAQAGLREVQFATAEANFAQAGKITQLEASLGNYYQDGTPGRALLEEQMTATADRLAGLSAQYTLKVQAGKYVAGIGLAATENPDGSGTSALIIAADKFAIVNPATYTTGLTNTPDPAHIPFGVDAQGIYLNNNVYVRGNMRIDTGGKTLADGLRGSLMADASGSWSDTAARNAIWTKLGKVGTPPNNNHLIIGDMVTMGATTRYWNGSAWVAPGVVLNGDMLVDGTVSASKINTHGLTIKNQAGQVVFTSGVDAGIPNWFVTGLGKLARQSQISIGSDSGRPTDMSVDGQNVYLADFISRFRKANADNLVNFMEYAAIGSAYIKEAAIDTLWIAGSAVTVAQAAYRHLPALEGRGFGNWDRALATSVYMKHAGWVLIQAFGIIGYGSGYRTAGTRLYINGSMLYEHAVDSGLNNITSTYVVWVSAGSTVSAAIDFSGGVGCRLHNACLLVSGVKR